MSGERSSARLDSERFARAFVAVRYLLGAREPDLGRPLACAEPSALLRELQRPARERRALALGAELLALSRALERRGLP